jgi:hypothetical protein
MSTNFVKKCGDNRSSKQYSLVTVMVVTETDTGCEDEEEEEGNVKCCG